MSKIDARARSIQETLHNAKYEIDYYQREYKWQHRNIRELLEDLETKFLENYEPHHEPHAVEHYDNYFLGSIVISHKDGKKFIIDGQQRLTSTTLLLIYLHNLQKASNQRKVNVSELIFSEKFGKKSFNLFVKERMDGMEALFNNQPYDFEDHASESVRTIGQRFDDIKTTFSDSLTGKALPYFIDWLLHKVTLVHIEANNEDDAYTIFETMNDRGLSLSPTDMLKGYLLANISEDDKKTKANDLWKEQILQLVAHHKDEELDFFKHWMRAKYARTVRERSKGTENKDFEQVATSFHKWVRENKKQLGLHTSKDYYDFIVSDFHFYTKQYCRILQATKQITKGLEHVYYNGVNNFTLQYQMLLSPLQRTDTQDIIDKKINMVAFFLDAWIVNRFTSYTTLNQSSLTYAINMYTKEIRDKTLDELAGILKKHLEKTTILKNLMGFRMHQQNKKYVHYLLARLTHHIEVESGIDSRFDAYTSKESKNPFQIEHIWANKYERHKHEFDHETEFAEYRNYVGGLLLIPKRVNQSYGDSEYKVKIKQYFGQNLLAKTLHMNCYVNNPGFLQYKQRTSLPFKNHQKFETADLDERQTLYAEIAHRIWNKDRLQDLK